MPEYVFFNFAIYKNHRVSAFNDNNNNNKKKKSAGQPDSLLYIFFTFITLCLCVAYVFINSHTQTPEVDSFIKLPKMNNQLRR